MLITEFTRALETVIPLAAIGYDKDAVGMQVGPPPEQKLTKALLAYELTSEVIAEARSAGANLIVAFHPLIFPSVRSIGENDRTGQLIRALIRSDIALYIQHTAFDAHPEFGTSRLMAEVLGLENIRPLAPLRNVVQKLVVFVPVESRMKVLSAMTEAGGGVIGKYNSCSFSLEGTGTFYTESGEPAVGSPKVLETVNEVRLEMLVDRWNSGKVVRAMQKAHPYEEVAYDLIPIANDSPNFGMGAIGEWQAELSVRDALVAVRKCFGTPVLRHNQLRKEHIRTVAVLGGAGMEFYSAASKADLFITADVRYHDFYRATHDNVLLVDAGHAETEQFVAAGMARAARKALDTLNLSDETAAELVLVAEHEPNAVRYFTE